MKRLVLVVAITLCLSLGAVGMAAADHSPDDGHSVDWTEQGADVGEEAAHSSSASSDDSVQTQSTDSGSIEVAITAAPPGETYGSNDTIKLFTGVLNTSSTVPQPIAGEAMTIEIENPDGSTKTITATTDENGSVVVSHNLTDRPDGSYTLTATHNDSGTQTSMTVRAGVSVHQTTTGSATFVGEETEVAYLARNGEDPAPGVPVTLEIIKNGSVIKNTTAQTGADGFVNFTFTPQEVGQYHFSPTADQAAYTDWGGSVEAVNYTTETDIFLADPVTQGQPATYFGRVTTVDGPASNLGLVIEFTDRDTGENFTVETTTDDRGFYHVDYNVPDSVDDLFVDIQTQNGDPVGVHRSYVPVRAAPTSDGGGGGTDPTFVDFSLELDEWESAPGETVNATLEATHDESAITDQRVDIVIRYDRFGAPVYSQTVTTDQNGQFQTQFTIPSNAIDGLQLTAEAEMDYQNETYEDADGVSIQKYEINDGVYEPGLTRIEVTSKATGEPVEGVPAFFDEQYEGQRFGTYANGALSSNGTGVDEASYEVPQDVGFYAVNNIIHRYSPTNYYHGIFPDYPGELNVGKDTAAPGEEVSVGFNGSDGTVAEGMVYGHLESPDTPFASAINTTNGGTITVPENATDGSRIDLVVWAIDDNGNLYQDREYTAITVDNTTTQAGFSVDPQSPLAGETATFDASQSTSADGALTYEWTFGDGTTKTGKQVQHTFDSAGEYNVTLTVTDESGTSDSTTKPVTVRDSITVSGTYVLANGSSAAGDTVAAFTDNTIEHSTLTDSSGAFSLLLPARSDPYDVIYGQGDVRSESDATNAFPEDSNVDINVTQAPGDQDTNLGTVQLPEGYNVNTTVVDADGAPVENALVKYRVFEPESNATGAWRDLTNADGMAATRFDRGPGLELAGPAEITVKPPEDALRFRNKSYVRELNVTEPMDIQIQLEEAGAVAAFDVATSEPTANETVTFNASTSVADAEVQNYSWDFGDGTTLTTSNETVTHTYESAGDYNVSLTIEDADGNTDSTTQTVTIQEEDPFISEDGAGFGAVAAVLALLATVLMARRR